VQVTTSSVISRPSSSHTGANLNLRQHYVRVNTQCKDPFGARLGTERTSASAHASLLTTCAPPFSLFTYSSFFELSNNIYRHNAATTRKPGALDLTPLVFLYSLTHYSLSPAHGPLRLPLLYKTRHTRQTVLMYIRPLSCQCSSRKASYHIISVVSTPNLKVSLIHLLSCMLSFGDRLVDPLRLFTWLGPRPVSRFSLPTLFSYLGDTPTLAASILVTPHADVLHLCFYGGRGGLISYNSTSRYIMHQD